MTAATGNIGVRRRRGQRRGRGLRCHCCLSEDGTRRVLQLEAGPGHWALTPADVRDG
jgi:hypothetical protein